MLSSEVGGPDRRPKRLSDSDAKGRYPMAWSEETGNRYRNIFFGILLSVCVLPLSALSETTGLEMGVRIDSEFKISLESNPTTGYKWEAKFDDNLLKLRSDTFHRPPDAIIGQGGTQTFIFLPAKAGETTIDFLYKRSWEQTPATKKQYRITIKP
jgi:inhibitor of cysteine peptidase